MKGGIFGIDTGIGYSTFATGDLVLFVGDVNFLNKDVTGTNGKVVVIIQSLREGQYNVKNLGNWNSEGLFLNNISTIIETKTNGSSLEQININEPQDAPIRNRMKKCSDIKANSVNAELVNVCDMISAQFNGQIDTSFNVKNLAELEGGRRRRTPKSSSKSPAKPAKPSAAKGPQPTDERVLVKGRTRVVYKGPKGGKYIKKDGMFVRL